MSKQLEVMAAVYENEDRAKTILDMLQKMHRASTITLADAAMVIKDGEGKVHIKETHEVTTKKGATRGAIVTGILGLIYPPSLIASALTGGVIGGVWGKLRDTGIKTGDMKQIAENLEPGKAAVIALSTAEWTDEIERALEGWDGKVVRHAFNSEETEKLEQAASADTTTAAGPEPNAEPAAAAEPAPAAEPAVTASSTDTPPAV